jgi:hypothetical protein|tara:strand:+ start:5259 stop:5492 length:234 start_codon:yes stop_codon:yes gene_type:complete
MFSKDDFDIPLEGQLRLRVIADEINECSDIDELRKQLIVSAKLVMTYQNILNRILKEQIAKDLQDFNKLLEGEDKLK